MECYVRYSFGNINNIRKFIKSSKNNDNVFSDGQKSLKQNNWDGHTNRLNEF